jgi:SAM-dependent methyltransferase
METFYYALHHVTVPGAVVRNVYKALRPGGSFLTAEPGAGHSRTEGSIQAVQRFGITEEDMPFSYQRRLMMDAGFCDVKQYLRFSELPLVPFEEASGEQATHFSALSKITAFDGFTSIVVASR